MTRRLARLLLLSLVVGCDPAAPAPEPVPWSVSVRDSSGVRVVEHVGIPSGLPVWSLSAEPDLALGQIEGLGPELFTHLSSAVMRSDGVIVVSDSQTREIRAFDSSGRHLWTAGGRGSGPGEFTDGPTLMLMPGDSLMAVVRGAGQVFDPGGGYVRQIRLESWRSDLGSVALVAILEDGTTVGRATRSSRPRPGPSSGYVPPAIPEGYSEVPYWLSFHDRDGGLVRELGSFPGTTRYVDEELGRCYRLGHDAVVQTAGGYGMLLIGLQETFRVFRYGGDGLLELDVRAQVRRIPPDSRRHVVLNRSAELNALCLGEALPAYDRVMIGPSGVIWVEEYVPIYDRRLRVPRVPAWRILDSGGGFMAEITLPDRFEPQQILEDRVLGIWLDELDVPYVRIHRIEME